MTKEAQRNSQALLSAWREVKYRVNSEGPVLYCDGARMALPDLLKDLACANNEHTQPVSSLYMGRYCLNCGRGLRPVNKSGLQPIHNDWEPALCAWSQKRMQRWTQWLTARAVTRELASPGMALIKIVKIAPENLAATG